MHEMPSVALLVTGAGGNRAIQDDSKTSGGFFQVSRFRWMEWENGAAFYIGYQNRGTMLHFKGGK
jgi:hypothetical protein